MKALKKRVFLSGLMLLVGLTVSVFSPPVTYGQSDNKPNFDIDAVSFASEALQLSRLDLFINVLLDELQFIKASDDEFLAEYEVRIEVLDDFGETVDSKVSKERVIVDDITETGSTEKHKLTKASFTLPPNQYKLLVELKDLETLQNTLRTTSVRLKDYSEPNSLASDILMLDDYSKDESGKVIFYPMISYTRREHAKLYAYFEVYNIPKDDSFQVRYEIRNSTPQSLWTDGYSANSSGQVTQNFIIIEGDSLDHGTYSVNVQIKHGGKTQNLKKPFDWYIEGLPRSFSDLDEAIDVLKYAASDQEYERLKNLKEEDKYQAYLEFWKQRDPTPQTSDNELRREYYQRIEYANRNYKGMRKAGWKTDMGWVYVILGAPDSIERNPFNQLVREGRSIKAIEIWIYYQHSRQLVFLDENGFGDFRLDNPQTLYDILR